jgi:hypothetical protein
MPFCKHNELLITGDSFCHFRHLEIEWPKVLCKLLTETDEVPLGTGFNACSWWSPRQELLAYLNNNIIPKVLVICHTESSRVPNDQHHGISIGCLEADQIFKVQTKYPGHDWDPDIWVDPRLLKATKQYYKYLVSENFHRWSRLAWWNELDSLTKQYSIPMVIHLHCFEDESLHIFANGHTHKTALFNVSKTLTNYGTKHRNHFSDNQNVEFARRLNHYIQSNFGKESGEFDLDLPSLPI